MNELSTDHQSTPDFGLVMLDDDKMNTLIRVADMMAGSVVSLPKHLQNKPADCLAICMQAAEWRINPFALAQKTHVINGALGYEAQLVNAVLQSTGAVTSRCHYEYRNEGQNVECRVAYVIRGETELTWGEWYAASSVKVKNSPLWATDPKQQLGYLQVKKWARQYCPGAVLGLRTRDDLEDAIDTPTGSPSKAPKRRSETPAPLVERVDQDGVITSPQAAAAPAPAESAPARQASAANPPAPQASGPSGAGITGGQVAYLRNKLKAAGVSEASICDRFQATSIELLTTEQFDEVKAELLAMA